MFDALYWKTTKPCRKPPTCGPTKKHSPFEGADKPEPLKHVLAGYWSQRINDEHRIIYTITDDSLLIAELRHHY
ncbi:Txe/YoeB family addiction module toxin [Halomonas sp. PR-M31]|uniref:Txe/YoeB family addiction module toxin n=1 Tax=Halomonas sp. PR-M31 TaxID=1471202 RepID=UPI0006521CC2|nr:Txe/YoeB family addiction module toxin [Halomonas sp. PR-M31]